MDETKTQATIGELARIVHKDRRTVALRLEQAGVEPCGQAGVGNRQARTYDVDQALEALKADPDTSELTKLKARKLRLEIERIEEANAIASGELVRLDAVKDSWTNALHSLHRSSTTRLPREIAGQAMQFAKSNNPTAEQIEAATRVCLQRWWQDVRDQKVGVQKTDLTPTTTTKEEQENDDR